MKEAANEGKTRRVICTLLGCGAHGTNPEKGTDALYAACQLVQILQTPQFSGRVTVCNFSAGTVRNVVAERAQITLAVGEADAEVREVAEELCAACGTRVEWQEVQA